MVWISLSLRRCSFESRERSSGLAALEGEFEVVVDFEEIGTVIGSLDIVVTNLVMFVC